MSRVIVVEQEPGEAPFSKAEHVRKFGELLNTAEKASPRGSVVMYLGQLDGVDGEDESVRQFLMGCQMEGDMDVSRARALNALRQALKVLAAAGTRRELLLLFVADALDVAESVKKP